MNKICYQYYVPRFEGRVGQTVAPTQVELVQSL